MKKKTITSKKHLFIIVSLFVVPLIICLLFYNYSTIMSLNSDVANNSKSTIKLYQKQFENQLNDLSIRISDLWANDYDHILLRLETDPLTLHLASVEIADEYSSILIKNNNVGGLFIFSEANDIQRYRFQERYYDTETTSSVKRYVEACMQDPDATIKEGWTPMRMGDHAFLFRMLGFNGGYTVIMVDLDITLDDLMSGDDEGFFVFSTSDGGRLAHDDRLDQDDLELVLSEFDNPYYITGESSRYFVVASRSDIMDAYVLFVKPYSGYLHYMSKIQTAFFILSFLMIALIPFYYILISKTYFKPMETLMRTMEKVRDGSIDEKADIGNYKIKELVDINDTFNQMMKEIKRLKIKTYEREIEKNKVFLQYLQMQIKPHFFLNCLKILYSFAEQKKHSNIQEMIIGLSAYLRNFFKDNMSMVTIDYEVEYVRNYINLQKNSMQQNVQCNIVMDEHIGDYLIPVLLIQTFVENCLKYARKPNEPLVIDIHIVELRMNEDTLIDITVQDNGPGFREEVLEQVNGSKPYEYSTENVGIVNVKQRLHLLYHDNAAIQLRNTESGASCEVILPVANKAHDGVANEHIDS